MSQSINFICSPECDISVSQDLSIASELSDDGKRQVLAIGQQLLSYGGEVSLYTSSDAGALVASRAIAETAKIDVHIISSALDKQSSRSNFEVDGKVEVIGLDEVGLPVYTKNDQERMTRFYEMVNCDPQSMLTYAVTEKGSIMALLSALGINNGQEIQPGSVTTLSNISGVSILASTTLPKLSDEQQDSQGVLAA